MTGTAALSMALELIGLAAASRTAARFEGAASAMRRVARANMVVRMLLEYLLLLLLMESSAVGRWESCSFESVKACFSWTHDNRLQTTAGVHIAAHGCTHPP